MCPRAGERDAPSRREYNTRYARRKRAQKLDRQRATSATCPFKQGRWGVCGAKLEIGVDRFGRSVSSCPKCARRVRGICQDCPRPVAGRVGSSLRCAECKRRSLRGFTAKYRKRDPERYEAKWRAQLAARHADPAKRVHDLAVKKAWRQRNVVKIKLEKRKWRLNPKRPNGYSSREKYEAYHRVYRQKHAEHRRELARAQYYREHPDRPHPICICGCDTPIPWDGNGRPRKWHVGHSPWHRSLTAQEILMSAVSKAITGLERAAERIRKKLEGTDALRKELEALEGAVAQLRGVEPSSEEVPRPKSTRRTTVKAA